jgi:hypothetical protein
VAKEKLILVTIGTKKHKDYMGFIVMGRMSDCLKE